MFCVLFWHICWVLLFPKILKSDSARSVRVPSPLRSPHSPLRSLLLSRRLSCRLSCHLSVCWVGSTAWAYQRPLERSVSQSFETLRTFSAKLIVLTCCIRGWHRDSNGDLNRGSNHKSSDLKVRFELPETAILGKLLRFGLRDFMPRSNAEMSPHSVQYRSERTWRGGGKM